MPSDEHDSFEGGNLDSEDTAQPGFEHGRAPARFDLELLGKIFDVTEPVTVTAQMIADYCMAIGEDNPAYTEPSPDDHLLTAPPSFAVLLKGSERIYECMPRYDEAFAAGQDLEYLAPIREGDRITLSSRMKETYEKTGRSGKMSFVVLRSTLTNQRGETVAHIDHRFVYRS